MRTIVSCTFAFGLLSSCASLHHVQIGDIENRTGAKARPINLRVNEFGFSVDVENRFIKEQSDPSISSQSQKFAALLGLIQVGPRTGMPVFSASYARNIADSLWEICPSGTISNLVSVRETRTYPAISGEFVKITGSCLTLNGGTP